MGSGEVMKAWHFLTEDGAMQWKCGRVLKPKVGQTLTRDPDKLELCSYGLHASVRLIDALQYAPGPILCRVEMGGRIIKGDDKLVASERTVLAMFDATRTLHEFAVWCAREALAQIKDPDKRSLAALEAKEAWLRGEISDAELGAARAAAWAAARAAAGDAARAAARAAAWDAARDVARAAARAAAWDAAWAAAWDAAGDAARAAAWAAARAAAGDAARDAQNKKLTKMVAAEMRGV